MLKVPCGNCDVTLSECVGGISILVMGDEYIFSYFLCPSCDEYTAESYRDQFLGDSSTGTVARISREEGDKIIEAIKACPDRRDKFCECASHRALYTGRYSPSGD